MGVTSSRPALVPHTLDPYTILEDLGRTPYGRAFRGLDPDGETPVVIVRVRPSDLPPEEGEALVTEARALTRLVQPGLPVVYEVREDDEGIHLVLAPPPDPAPSVATVRDRETWVRLGTRLLLRLAEAHAGGILHRHLGASSVHWTGPGSLTLTGFGLTRLADDPTWEAPPEVARGEPATLASDLYATGRLMLRWAEGTQPALLGDPTEDPLTAVLIRATADDPAERYDDAADMARALSLAANGPEEIQQLGRSPAAMPATDSPERSSRGRRSLFLALGLAAVVLGGVLVAGDFWGAKDDPDSKTISETERRAELPPAPPPGAFEGRARSEQEAPESAPARLERARSLVEEGRVAEAVPLLEEVLASGELANPVPVLDLLGTLWLQAGRPDEAADLLARATALQPDSDLLYKLGLALAAAGRPAQAAEQLRAARELDPESPRIREALRHLGDN